MQDPGAAARETARAWIGTGLLVAAVLATIAAAALDRGTSAGLALVAVAALAARCLLGLADIRAALGPFASPFDMALDLALALAAAWLTGGLRSPLLLVPAAGLVLSRRFHGPAAARFLALATVLGLLVLAAASPAMLDAPVVVAIARVLWPVAVLAGIEIAQPGRAQTAVPPPPSAPVAAAAVAPVPERDFRSEILHDLRSPLSVIKVYSDLIAERARRGEPPVDEHLRNLASEIELMTLLVDGPTASRARAASRPHDAVDLGRLLGELTGRYRETHGDKVRIEMSAERPRVEVRADPVALQRVFRNVLDNALQYTPAGGTVRVRLWADAVHAHVVVSDTGVGMTPEERDRAFDMAYRGRGAQALRAGGRGLGLTLSRELVEAMGGTISLWSEEDRGSEVRVLLPVPVEVTT